MNKMHIETISTLKMKVIQLKDDKETIDKQIKMLEHTIRILGEVQNER